MLLKNFSSYQNDLLKDYPLFNVAEVSKYLLSIYPPYHTRLFPDSILNNENFDIIQDVSHTNSIHKVYLCSMNVGLLQPNDLLVIYRTSDQPGRAYYRSVATSVCVVEEIRRINSFANVEEFLTYSQRYSIFSEDELREWFTKRGAFVIKMTYNAAFSRRLTRGVLIEEIGLNQDSYWGFMSLTDEQFNHILNRGGVNESLVVNQA